MRGLRPILMLLLAGFCWAGDIVIDGEPQSYLNPNWELTGKDLIVKGGTPYIRINTQGNCRWESRQVCYPTGHGGVTCRPEWEWVCDYESTLFDLPSTIVAVDGEVRYQSGDLDLKIGVQKSFLFWKWVRLEGNVGLYSDIQTAKLIIRDAGEVEQELRFLQLHNLDRSNDTVYRSPVSVR